MITSRKPLECDEHGLRFVERTGIFGTYLVCPMPCCDRQIKQSDHDGLWRLTTKAERQQRMAAHRAFDALWREGFMSRKQAYEWLGGMLGLKRDDCHIGHFDGPTCQRVIEAATQRLERLTLANL